MKKLNEKFTNKKELENELDAIDSRIEYLEKYLEIARTEDQEEIESQIKDLEEKKSEIAQKIKDEEEPLSENVLRKKIRNIIKEEISDAIKQENEKKELTPTGEEDFWGRKIYKDKKGQYFVDVEGTPHDVTDEGEPLDPIRNYKINEDHDGSDGSEEEEHIKKWGGHEKGGEDFDPEEFFGQASHQAQSDIEAEEGEEEYASLGSFEDVNKFVKDLRKASKKE